MRILVGLGRELWNERLKTLEKAECEVTEEQTEEEPDDRGEEIEVKPIWTPEAVARGIEHSIMHGAHLLRRARWLCLLSESSLAWETRNAGGHFKTILLFENGAVSSREELTAEKQTPLSPGYAKRIHERRKIFDVATYERLRVVTTELRRLVAEGRSVEIHLRPNATLRRRQLARMLPWV